ncbi:MAG: ACP S-malonyltransferase [Halanaerobiales bacterium]|nr:ACP S-malonyltransferase [Halanaerobiales bacterium]
MEKIAFLFTGQGAQYVGMAKSFYDEHEVARQTFEEANDILGFDIAKLCFEGPLGQLSKMENMQLALLTVSTVAHRVYMKEIGIAPHFCAGHSMGEYSALVSAGAIKFSDALKILVERGKLTKKVVDSDVGAMTIIDDLDSNIVAEECKKISTSENFVTINCYNSPLQVAVAGHQKSVEILEERVLDLGGQITPLITSAPVHTLLMKEASEKLQLHLQEYNFYPFRNAVISNVHAAPYGDSENIRNNLALHLVRPVRWQETMKFLEKYGVTLAIEMGPKNVLCNLVKANTSNIDAFCYGQREDREILYDRLYKNEQLRKHVPTVVTRCLAIAVATPNCNWDEKEYAKGVIEPHKKIRKMQEELEKQGLDPTVDQMIEALEMLRSVFDTKKLPKKEQVEWFNQIFEETGMYYELKDFNVPEL